MRVVRDGDVYSRKWVTHEMDIEERGRVLTNLKHNWASGFFTWRQREFIPSPPSGLTNESILGVPP